MSDVAIRVEGLSKRYRIGSRQESYKTLREAVTEAAVSPFRRLRSLASSNGHNSKSDPTDTIWALRNVSFEVRRGEVLGIIGRNGAGKSTLLKILSRITEPTEGYADIHGRVGSLLEVGTGFHPELTGRENIFLNGAVLGMKKTEIKRRFDEIVAFAEVEKFIDTPVKRYSTGMYLRLAFSVAAHLEPEILLVDEVLAVGDAEFQKKCLGKMQEAGGQGRTVLFVSHNMPAITTLCPRVILLDHGSIVRDGASYEVVSSYLRSGRQTTAEKVWLLPQEAPGNEIVRLRAARVRTEEGEVCESIDIRKPVGIEIEFDVLEANHILVPNFHFFTEAGVVAFVAGDHDPAWKRRPRPKGRFVSTAWIPGNFLAEGEIVVGAAVSTMRPTRVHFYVENALAFNVIDSLDGETARGDYHGQIPGVVRPLLEWSTQFIPNGHQEPRISEVFTI